VIGAPLVDIEEHLYRPVTSYEYDPLGNPTKIISPEGHTTEFAYTLYGKPYYIRYPDGTTEQFEYDIEGRLIKEVGKTGIETLYTLDTQGRVTKKECSQEGNFLFKTEARFDNLHLREEIDAAGFITTYSYDGLGRKISTTKGDLITTLDYDSLGRVVKTTLRSLSNPKEGSVQGFVYDVLDRVIQEWTGSCDGRVLTQIHFGYDEAGNRSRIEQEGAAGISTTKMEYDTHGIPTRTIDPEGNVTYSRTVFNQINKLGQRILAFETIDPLGICSVTIQDTHGKVVESLKKNSFGDVLQKTEFQRNGSGFCVATFETVYLPNQTTKQIVNRFEYDCMGRQVVVIQAAGTPEEKRTTEEYNLFGQKIATTKPSGESLLYTYDSMGRLRDYKSADGTIHYRYTYDICSNPNQVENLIDQNATHRTYDIHGRVLEEKLANSLSLKMTYTPEGNVKTLRFPDGSSVKYTYDGSLLKRVERLNQGQISEYTHEYKVHDLGGRLLESSLIQLGIITHQYDLKGQFTAITSPYYKEDLDEAYDPLGNLTKRTYQDPIGTEEEQFAYDPLNQLTGEKNHSYTYDSIHNRCSKDGRLHTHNALNQLLSDGKTSFTYDLNLNRSHASHENGSHTYLYDALDRLKTLRMNDDRYEFFYDENNRCIAQKIYQNDILIRTEKLLYMGQDDIGTADDQGHIHTIRILGKGLGAEIGAAVALEIHGKTYAPLHDHNGNVTVLVDPSGAAAESYRYTAFGEEQIFNSSGDLSSHSLIGNPWRFSSKRHIGDYILFGRRFYDPFQGRWLTPDPAGYSAGPNLYAYVGNNPLTHFDLYGLIDDDNRPSFFDWACDTISSAWDTVRDSASSAYEMVRDSAGSVFQNVYDAQRESCSFASSITRHAVVFPYVRDLLAAPLHYAAHGNFDEYPFSCDQEPSQQVNGPGEHQYFDLRFYTINGINTPLSYFKGTLGCQSELFGTRVDGLYNSTGTIPGDLLDVAAEKLGIPTDNVNLAVQGIRQKVREVGGVGSTGIVALSVHSEGGQILACALKQLSREEKNMLAVCTLGSAQIIRDKDLRYVINYISDCDPIPWGADPVTYYQAKSGLIPEVQFLPSQGSMYFDHDVRGGTYEYAQNLFKKELYEEIRR
jgi:RHS repeat-associated protein